MASLGRIALAALGILAYQNRDKLGANESGLDQVLKGGMAGLSELLNRLRNAGSGDAVDSWVGKGANQPIKPANVEAAIDEETLESLVRQTGMSREEILDRLAVDLPKVVDDITPDGRLPDDPADPVRPPSKP